MALYLILGATYAFAAAVQPGPFQVFLVSRTLSHGWRRTLPASLSPLISDGPIIVLALVALSQLPASFEHVLRLGGGVFLLCLAWGAFGSWRGYEEARIQATGAAKRTVLEAAVVNLLNPNPYLGWSLVMGPLLLRGWRETPAHGIALVLSFYTTMALTLATIIVVFGTASRLGPRVGRALVLASAVALACFGGCQLWWGTRGLLAGG